MKVTLVLLVLSVLNYSHGGVVPASRTLVRSSSSIIHPPSPVTYYSQQHAPQALAYTTPQALAYSTPQAFAHSTPLAFAYSAPQSYSPYAVAPSFYAHQQLLAPAHYAQYVQGPVYAQHQVLDHQHVYAQHPSVIAQNPVAGQYPVGQPPVGQYPVEQSPSGQYPIEQPPNGQYPDGIQDPSQVPNQDGSFVIEAADNPQSPPSQPPFQPPQQQPISSEGSPGSTTVDDDTVTVEAA